MPAGRARAYSDAASRIYEPYYVQAEALLAEGKTLAAIAAFKNAGAYSDATARAAALQRTSDVMNKKLSAGYSHTVGLRADGTVVAVGYDLFGQCGVSGWNLLK